MSRKGLHNANSDYTNVSYSVDQVVTIPARFAKNKKEVEFGSVREIDVKNQAAMVKIRNTVEIISFEELDQALNQLICSD